MRAETILFDSSSDKHDELSRLRVEQRIALYRRRIAAAKREEAREELDLILRMILLVFLAAFGAVLLFIVLTDREELEIVIGGIGSWSILAAAIYRWRV